ncbi:uncharacterized protein N7483_000224 [Penicillium malachiteum]|uniref:uncharacterized protein n=1 Tax=Penicillium malachiteum TaxID=1324776 RepID=UPI00254684E8|nr:uncharacterized protein N7483_000224 [Penicillium malachiteum]KAJ5735099.1 hypothetical protein N7483_000224 [Penicillium malachiteum]
MDPSSLTTIVTTSYQIGTKVIEIFSTWKNADREVEQRVIIFEHCWNRTKRQVDFVMRIISTIDDEQRQILDSLLTELSLALSLALSSLETVIRKDSLERPSMLRLALRARRPSWVWKKNTIDTIISDLEKWQGRFDPSWFLLMKIAEPIIDRALAQARITENTHNGPATAAQNPLALAAGIRSVISPNIDQIHQNNSIILPESPMEWLDIPFSTARAGRQKLSHNTRSSWYIIDTIEISQTARGRSILRDVRILAAKLSKADPLAFGLLNCKGVIAVQLQQATTVPSPQLRSATGFSSTIAPAPSSSHAFLVGFDAFRATSTGTIMGGDMSWDRNVYRHPSRQDRDPTERYRMQHDIYSLGVCLLEIGLWESFVEYTDDESTGPQPKFGKCYHNFQAWLREQGTPSSFDAVAYKLKEYFIEQAGVRLVQRMGDMYAQVTMLCLTCLDDDNEYFEGMEEGGVSDDLVAVQFIEKVMKSINDIRI